nr:MAG TPA: hypothetical protein [Inoviridae sp.]
MFYKFLQILFYDLLINRLFIVNCLVASYLRIRLFYLSKYRFKLSALIHEPIGLIVCYNHFENL